MATNPTLPPGQSNECQDIDECLDNVCGDHGTCVNNPGSYECDCHDGYHDVTDAMPVCQDIDECVSDDPICGPNTNCTNSVGFYNCTCFLGYRTNSPDMIASIANPCTDIDECNLQEILDEINPPEGQTKERAFLGNMDKELKENKGIILPEPISSGVGPRAGSIKLSSEGDGETGSVILNISESLVSAMVQPGQTQTKKTMKSSTVDLSLRAITPGSNSSEISALSAKENTMDINLASLAKHNNGSAAAAFMILNGMESLLSHRYFETENKTEMFSDVFTAILPSMNNTKLTEPMLPERGLVTCVYWEETAKETEMQEGNETERDVEKSMRWSVQGCWVADTNENHTVCSCSHLSTFALILQIGEPPPDNPFLEWLNRILVIVGLFFFALAILTFLLCSWNPKINNTARLHLCLNLSLSHLLLLWNDTYVEHELACTVMAGLLHFLIVASFVWMLLEALQLHMLVKKLSKVQVIQRDGLPKPLLYLIGYGVPVVIVGVSALVYADGYGATDAKVCWLSQERNFNWALTGPVIAVIALNCILLCATLWSLRPTLSSMKSDISQSKDTRIIMFKILAQFVILGCTWILGLYQTNLFFEVLFVILISQQGTFLFFVHCLLNKEVREEYMKWLTCSFNKTDEKELEV
ncbi:adhesion G protein-coupled receptor E1-like [Leuresthes tenuis]|uniref:adhesion G protein-coupled receptor E1-like n=1 Tax=Leuresthes tenuis TaxID=355514 RepID=UPI003B50693E